MKNTRISCPNLTSVLFLILYGIDSFLFCSAVKGDENLLKVLGAGVSEWINNTEFKCSYSYTEGVVDSIEKAEKQPDNLDKITLYAEGQLIKTKKKTFLSQIVEQDLYTPRQSESFFGVINEQLEAHYVPSVSGGSPQSLFVFERDKGTKDIPYPVVQPPTAFNPINYISNLTRSVNTVRKIDPSATITTSMIDSDNIEVSFQFKESSGNQNSRKVVFLTAHTFPIPVESYSKITYAGGKEYVRKCVASDFVDVGSGIKVPQRIIQYEGPFFDWRGKEYEGKWLVKKWGSTDLGKAKPVDSDFLIPLNPNTSFGGLVTEMEIEFMKIKPSHFDIDSITLVDLQISSLGGKLVASSSSRVFYLKLFLVLFGFALILIVCIRIALRMLVKK